MVTKRDWCEAAPVDGDGSVEETLAQNWTPFGREVQHECADSHQRRSARMDYSEICVKALRCGGLRWWRWRQLHWKEDKWAGPLLERR